MTSQVFFRFKNAISQDQVLFDGSVIQVGDVKRLIATKRGLGPEGAVELTLFDSNTNDEYTDDGKVIPRNSLVIVKRAPVTKFKPLQSSATAAAPASAPADQDGAAPNGRPAAEAATAGDEFGGDYYSDQPQRPVVGEDEDKALQNLLQGTAATWQREVRQGAMRGRGRGRGGRGMPPLDYRCSRCEAVGQHWVQDCPTQGDPNFDRKRIRPPVGIPMTRLAKSEEGGLILPDGQTGTLVANEDAFAREILGLPTAAAAAEPAVPQDTQVGGAAAVSDEQPEDGKEVVPVLLLDNKPHEAKPEPATASTGVVHASGSQLALPRLAGEEELASPAVTMPGAAFFDMFMQSVVMPRGPPEFLMKAFQRDEPLPRTEFEELQDEYRARYFAPSFPSRSGPPGRHSPARPGSRAVYRGGSRSPEARSAKEGEHSRHSRPPEQRSHRESERKERSRSRSKDRRRSSRDRREGRRSSSIARNGDKDRNRDRDSMRSPHGSSRREDKKPERPNEKESRSERDRSRRREREDMEKSSRGKRSHSTEREHKRRHHRSKQEEGKPSESERWQPKQEPTPEPVDFSEAAGASSLPAEEMAPAEEPELLEQKLSESPVVSPADVDARQASPRNPSPQPARSNGADEVQPQQGSGNASDDEVQVSGGAAAKSKQLEHEPVAEAAPPVEGVDQGNRHHKRHKKEKRERKEKKEKREKKERKEKHREKRKHRSRSRDRSLSAGRERRAEEQARLAAEQLRQQKEEEEERARREAADSAEQEAAAAAARKSQRRAEREKERAAERAAAEAEREEEERIARDKKLGPRLFDRAIVAAMRDKRSRHGDKHEGEEGKKDSKRSKWR